MNNMVAFGKVTRDIGVVEKIASVVKDYRDKPLKLVVIESIIIKN